MIDFPGTIWSIVWKDDNRWISRVGQVLRYCETIIKPQRMLLFSHNRLAEKNYPFDIVYIPELNWQSYNIFINRVVPLYIDSPFSMSVHEDGFPIDPSQWDPIFLEYDYVGAPWSDGRVGNGGFNIESRKLLELKTEMPVGHEDFELPSDRLICDVRKDYLEAQGVRFATFDVALRFSTEQVGNERPSFGFHGRAASADKYRKAWKMVNYTPKQHQGFTLQRNKVVAPHRLGVNPPPRPKPPPLPPRPVSRPAGELKLLAGPVQRTLPEIAVPTENLTATIVYVYPVVAGQKYHDYANRFIRSYQACLPDCGHQSVVVLNGGRSTPELQSKFGFLPNLRLLSHDNSGYDLGAFQKACKQCDTDIVVFFGASTYFNQGGWLKRMLEVSAEKGLALYGAMGNCGDARYRVWPHIRTTAFWTNPKLFNAYPRPVRRTIERHAFEHGPENLTGWVAQQGLKAWVVTWTDVSEWPDWDKNPQGFQRGVQSAVLAYDHICDPPYYQPK